jgi:hypothetical protein
MGEGLSPLSGTPSLLREDSSAPPCGAWGAGVAEINSGGTLGAEISGAGSAFLRLFTTWLEGGETFLSLLTISSATLSSMLLEAPSFWSV